MLVLSRKMGERIIIGDNIELVVIRIQGDKVRLGFEAPEDVTIHREEIYRKNEFVESSKNGQLSLPISANIALTDQEVMG